jgi:hypothetical protein
VLQGAPVRRLNCRRATLHSTGTPTQHTIYMLADLPTVIVATAPHITYASSCDRVFVSTSQEAPPISRTQDA